MTRRKLFGMIAVAFAAPGALLTGGAAQIRTPEFFMVRLMGQQVKISCKGWSPERIRDFKKTCRQFGGAPDVRYYLAS